MNDVYVCVYILIQNQKIKKETYKIIDVID